WRAERVPTHRMEYIETLEPFVPRPAVGQDITAPMPYMQSRPRRVGKHIEAVIFRARIIVLRLMEAIRSPGFAPLRLDCPRSVVLSRHNPMIITYGTGCLCWPCALVVPGATPPKDICWMCGPPAVRGTRFGHTDSRR